jgi:hypothetical protein
MARRDALFTTIRTEGGLLPIDLLALIAQGDKSVPGVSPQDYHLVKGEQFGTRITDSWNRLRNAWKDFSARLAAAPEDETGTTLTRDKWLLVLFEELGFGRLPAQRALHVDDKEFPVSHGWGHVPIHLISAKLPIDRRTPGARGAAGASPHSMVQELLNRSDEHLWAFVSNGRVLRILRDNAALTRQAFVEFDLEAMFSDEVYEDFVVLWRTCHQSRVEADNAAECWLEQWTKVAAETGTRARDDLRGGVEAAIEALGTGFVAHPANSALKERLRSGDLDSQDLYRQLLRVIYRLLFLFVAEDRNLLHPPGAALEAQRRYQRFYSLNRIRRLAARRRGGPHPDLWSSMTVVFDGLGRPDGIPALALPGLGSFLWSPAASPDLDRAQIANQYLLAAVRHLGYVEDRNERVLRPIDYRNLGTEELGAIYESLLEQHPEVNTDAGTFTLNTAAGNERKTTGSYYTPTSLITELLDSAVDPVLDEACSQPDPETALLDLSVVDPACGSGHFLIAAAHRIAKRLAAVRTGDDEPSPDATRSALRDVIARCIHGIDLNPMAVELCKVSLWMESMEPGKPLGFLDHRIVRGNGLIGATPELLDAGVPDDAFKPLTGDDKATVTSLKKRNKAARSGQQSLFTGGVDTVVGQMADQLAEIDQIDDADLTAVTTKAQRWSELVNSPEYQAAVHAADTWCAAFVAPKTPTAPAITHDEYAIARDNPGSVHPDTRHAVDKLAERYAFLHWHLAFPDIHTRGGFDLVLGNPPWEKVKLSEKEFFAARDPEIANLAGAKRKTAINRLQSDNPALWDAYQEALRQADGDSHFIRSSGRYPLCGRGDVNTYAIFAEAMCNAISSTGRLGVILPTGIATDDTTKHFFEDIVTRRQLVSLFDFENALRLFPGIAVINRFALLTLAGRAHSADEAEFVFFAHQTGDLVDPERCFTLSPADLTLINPNTKTAPIFRRRRDAEITKAIYRRVPVLVRDDDPDGNPWGIEYQRMFDMANDSHLFRTADELQAEGATLTGNSWVKGKQKWLPLYEAKMAHQYNHRDGDYAKYTFTEGKEVRTLEGGSEQELADPAYLVSPRYWVERDEVVRVAKAPAATWLLGFRDITNTTTNRRTMVSFALPLAAVGHQSPLIWATKSRPILSAVLSSFALDYVARQKIGGSHMTFFVLKQLAVLHPDALIGPAAWSAQGIDSWIGSRALELTYTAWDLQGFAADLGHHGPPFKWDPVRRELLRAELDAAFFHLYGIDRDDVDYIMDTFPIVKRKDEAAHGEYRTKRLILERYDALAAATAVGAEYQTVLNPPPADPSCAHPESTRPAWA